MTKSEGRQFALAYPYSNFWGLVPLFPVIYAHMHSCKVGHGALMANFRAGCSSCSCAMTISFVTDAVVLIERAVSC